MKTRIWYEDLARSWRWETRWPGGGLYAAAGFASLVEAYADWRRTMADRAKAAGSGVPTGLWRRVWV